MNNSVIIKPCSSYSNEEEYYSAIEEQIIMDDEDDISESDFYIESYLQMLHDEHERYMSLARKSYDDGKIEDKRDLSKDDIKDLSRYHADGLLASLEEQSIITHPKNTLLHRTILLLSLFLFIGYSVMILRKNDDILDNNKGRQLRIADIGDIVTFGRYEQDNDENNGTEDIEWIVLDKEEDGTLLLLSVHALETKQYHNELIDVTWETCTLREWLNSNDAFYGIAFNEKEKKMILTTELKNNDNLQYGTEGGNDTSDMVFLLSKEDAKYDKAKQCTPTPHALASGIYIKENETACWWWLRSPGISNFGATFVNNEGNVDTFGYVVNYDFYGVRPALRVNPSSSVQK